MRLNHVALRHEMTRQRWRVTDLAVELTKRGVQVHRTHLSNIVNGRRPATFAIIEALAEILNVNPYGLLGPEDPKTAVKELVDGLGLTAAELFPTDDLEQIAS